jgi:hypothetical protein
MRGGQKTLQFQEKREARGFDRSEHLLPLNAQ